MLTDTHKHTHTHRYTHTHKGEYFILAVDKPQLYFIIIIHTQFEPLIIEVALYTTFPAQKVTFLCTKKVDLVAILL